MKCDTEGCGNEATVSETLIRGGKRVERHLCEECARKQGIVVQSHAPINELLAKFVMQQAVAQEAGQRQQERAMACTNCGTTWAKFRQGGLLGCARCYEAFEEALAPLIDRAQSIPDEPRSRHVGKSPRRAGRDPIARARSVAVVRRELDDAVHAEQYERAARLRDELRRLAPDAPSDTERAP